MHLDFWSVLILLHILKCSNCCLYTKKWCLDKDQLLLFLSAPKKYFKLSPPFHLSAFSLSYSHDFTHSSMKGCTTDLLIYTHCTSWEMKHYLQFIINNPSRDLLSFSTHEAETRTQGNAVDAKGSGNYPPCPLLTALLGSRKYLHPQ